MSASNKGLLEFVAEANEIVEALGRDLLVLDERRGQEPEPELINGIFRGAHSLKGLAALFGQDRTAQLAHGMEDLLDRLRLGKVEPSDEVIDALIEALEVLQRLLAEAASGEEQPRIGQAVSALAARLQAVASSPGADSQEELESTSLDPKLRSVLTEYEEHRLRESLRKGLCLWKVRAVFSASDFDQGLPEVSGRLRLLGEVICTLPSSEPGEEGRIAFDLLVATLRGRAELTVALAGLPARVSELPGHHDLALPERGPSTSLGLSGQRAVHPELVEEDGARAAISHLVPAPRSPGVRPELEGSLRSLTQTVRVDIARLDALMNAVGELLLIKANVQRLAETARQSGAAPLARPWGQELQRESRALERKLTELQTGILEARMVPLRQVFDKLARLVRRIAREAGKEIDFRIGGGEVELDKLIVEELSDPLMHIIRNAIDHGIEPPEQRARVAKPRRGVVGLRALQRGNHVLIEVSDDGAGLDEARIRDVAIRRGILTGMQAEEMSRREVQNLIFVPGFSTARTVSELSGRGVGLDVVKTNIANLSGMIDVASEPGAGTTFSLTLPVTLAIIRALLVSASERTYAVPLNSVLEIVSVRAEQIRTIEREEVISLRDHTVRLTRLARHFRLPERRPDRLFVVVVGLAQERVGIAVDELVGQQDVVIKPLGGRLRHTPGIAGATDLGNRRTVLVLDVGALIDEVLSPERRAELA